MHRVKVHLTIRVICTSFLASIIVAFLAGRWASVYIAYFQDIKSKYIKPRYKDLHVQQLCNTCRDNENGYCHSTQFETIPSKSRRGDLIQEKMEMMSPSYEIYNEAFVHPIMLTHNNTRRVAIIGEDQMDFSLQEILKHKTVDMVTYIDVGESLNANTKWSDCTNLVGSTTALCREDSRVDVIKEKNVTSWLSSKFSQSMEHESSDKNLEKFDVLFLDAVSQLKETGKNIDVLVESLCNALSTNGMIALQLGSILDKDVMRQKPDLINLFVKAGFKSIHDYTEKYNLSDSWNIVILLKDRNDRVNWYANIPITNVLIHKRIYQTKSSSAALRHFDGATMKGFQVPPKFLENEYCMRDPRPSECGKNEIKKRVDAPLSSFVVQNSTIGEGSGRGLFAKVDIKTGSTIGLKESLFPVYLPAITWDLINTYYEKFNETDARKFYNYVEGYGWESDWSGNIPSAFVEPNFLTYVNHGCNGSNNVDYSEMYEIKMQMKPDLTEQNTEPSDFGLLATKSIIYSPYRDRHVFHEEVKSDIVVKDIVAGEEVFSDYLFYTTENQAEFYKEAQHLKGLCNGEEVGLVTQKELSHQD